MCAVEYSTGTGSNTYRVPVPVLFAINTKMIKDTDRRLVRSRGRRRRWTGRQTDYSCTAVQRRERQTERESDGRQTVAAACPLVGWLAGWAVWLLAGGWLAGWLAGCSRCGRRWVALGVVGGVRAEAALAIAC